jgi:hypothetical protein
MLTPEHFHLQDYQKVVHLIDSLLFIPIHQAQPGGGRNFWKHLDDLINIRQCKIFSYVAPDEESDVFRRGKLWAFSYFFYNKWKKQVVFFTCGAVSKLHSPLLTTSGIVPKSNILDLEDDLALSSDEDDDMSPYEMDSEDEDMGAYVDSNLMDQLQYNLDKKMETEAPLSPFHSPFLAVKQLAKLEKEMAKDQDMFQLTPSVLNQPPSPRMVSAVRIGQQSLSLLDHQNSRSTSSAFPTTTNISSSPPRQQSSIFTVSK